MKLKLRKWRHFQMKDQFYFITDHLITHLALIFLPGDSQVCPLFKTNNNDHGYICQRVGHGRTSDQGFRYIWALMLLHFCVLIWLNHLTSLHLHPCMQMKMLNAASQFCYETGMSITPWKCLNTAIFITDLLNNIGFTFCLDSFNSSYRMIPSVIRYPQCFSNLSTVKPFLWTTSNISLTFSKHQNRTDYKREL